MTTTTYVSMTKKDTLNHKTPHRLVFTVTHPYQAKVIKLNAKNTNEYTNITQSKNKPFLPSYKFQVTYHTIESDPWFYEEHWDGTLM